MTQTSEKLGIMVRSGMTMDDILKEVELSKFRVIHFLREQEEDSIIRNFLENIYHEFRVKGGRVIIVADTHLGGDWGDYKLVDEVYNYASGHNIKNIVHLGDIIEGYANLSVKPPQPTSKQIEELVKKYPRYSDVHTYYLLGNHDYFSQNDTHYNEFYIYEDLVPYMQLIGNNTYIGALRSYFDLDGNLIKLWHSDYHYINTPELDHTLELRGHSHLSGQHDKQVSLLPLRTDGLGNISESSFYIIDVEDSEYVIRRFCFKPNYKIYDRNQDVKVKYKK